MQREMQSVVRAGTSEAAAGAHADTARLFTDLYERHFDFVWRSVRMLGMAPDVADDVVQDVFLVAHRRLADFETRSSPRTWLFAITRRVVSGHRRSHRRWLRLLTRAGSDDRAPSQTPFEATAKSEWQRSLAEALAELPEEQRVVFALTELEEMSAPEIASALGVNVNTVYSRLRIARHALAERLQFRKSEAAP